MSSNNIEIEAKALLTKKDYQKLLENMPFSEETKIQENYFLDSEDHVLSRYGMVVRLRRREGRNKLTMKAPLSEGLLEKNQMLSDEETDALLVNNLFPRGEICDFLEILSIDPTELHVLAHLTTDRKESIFEGCPINISKNTYADVVDYELECDSDSTLNSQNTLRRICSLYDIEYVPNNLSKQARAFKAIEKK